MTVRNIEKYLPPVVDLARRAGETIRAIYQRQFTVTQKSDFSPVTEADIASHEQIVVGLSALTPQWPVLSEEDVSATFADRASWDTFWLVDPLDGTREFIKRNDEFTVNIALIDKHQPVLGVVYVPMRSVCYYAHKGGGAFKIEANSTPTVIASRAWHGDHLVIAGSRSHRSDRFTRFLERFNSYEVMCVGSSLKSCFVAEGRADIYIRFGPTSEWDTAAAHSIVSEAGGNILGLDMLPLRYNTKESLLNPPFIVAGDLAHDWRRYIPE